MSYSGYRRLLIAVWLVALLAASGGIWFWQSPLAWSQLLPTRNTTGATRSTVALRQRDAYGGVPALETRQVLDVGEPKSAASVPLGANVTSEETFYEIRGLSAEAVADQINTHGPTDGAIHYAANTRWIFSWSYRYRSDGKSCTISSVNVDVKIIYTYPRWVDADAAAPKLAARWKTFMEALVIHEQGHGTRAAEAGAQLVQALYKLEPVATCTELGQRAEALSSAIIADHNQHQTDYDTHTHHGESQGATW